MAALLATPSAPSAPVYQTSTNNTTTEDLFAGLNFPEVPTNIVYNPRSVEEHPDVQRELPTQPTLHIDDYAAPQIRVAPMEPVAQMSSEINAYEESVMPSTQLNFSKLYQNVEAAVVAPSRLYPEIPSINPLVQAQSDNMEENANETSSLLGSGSTIASAATYPIAALPNYTNFATAKRIGQQQVQQYTEQLQQPRPIVTGTVVPTQNANAVTSNDNLISELVNENSRLNDEIQSLRLALQQQQQQATQHVNHASTQSHRRGPIAHQQQYQQWLQRQQPPPQERPQPVQLTAQTGMNTPSQTLNMTQVPGILTRDPNTMSQQNVLQPGMKYVCCGGCRQWLLAPSDANLVACNGCHSVNNCSLSPNPIANQPAQVASSSTQLTTPSSSWVPSWLGGCFK